MTIAEHFNQMIRLFMFLTTYRTNINKTIDFVNFVLKYGNIIDIFCEISQNIENRMKQNGGKCILVERVRICSGLNVRHTLPNEVSCCGCSSLCVVQSSHMYIHICASFHRKLV